MTNFKTGGPWITRFAPSPTGALHLGNVRTAILNVLLARQSGGKFLLRLEDTDQERSTFAAEAAILWSLSWLGLAPDEPVRHQSLRLDLYREAVGRLVAEDQAYPCFCTDAELERDRQDAAARNLPPRYSGRCARMSTDERQMRLEHGEAHAVRFRLPEKADVAFTDLIKGEVTVPAGAFGDFVLLRSNGWPSYNLAVVVDDADMGVNLVLRGEDHLTNTARQILLYEAFGHPRPTFAHHGLLMDSEGKKLSKRSGALSIPDCMDMGLEPLAVVQYLASLSGALPTKNLFSSIDEMAGAFNPFALGRGNAVMSLDELGALSARAFRTADLAGQAARLDESLPAGNAWHGVDPAFRLELVSSLRENASNLRELVALLPLFTEPQTRFAPAALNELASCLPVLRALDGIMADHLPDSRLTKDAASLALRRVSEEAGVKGRQLYHPIRLALTGSDSGPELVALLTLLPTGQIRERVSAVLNLFP
ncbi:MAG: glutamate--tRNA ligase [Desulfomicrobium sp.]|nr:glutamate--tRNA ligase [Pseudomonadota bacterium]MBV1713843.1 glutamate--tRNA ligase [Desulfomicrobium sp.]MBU4572378.1 glutamate--tRNA ligase [Pseudomonadota bacterium]MBU4594358.1 glutamate--tRNA ligase [Pseudomonadota bacterium]MBV1719525.1 glutamate--tRNA ligase [Desulfomicrobium sp.]